MIFRVRPLQKCDKKGCPEKASRLITFETHREELPGPKVCYKHINWGKQRAKEMENS